MKKLLIVACAALALSGVGCASKQAAPAAPAAVPSTQTYDNAQYGFSFQYPAHDEVHVRPDATRADTYLGQKVDFFASLRDDHRAGETQPINLAYIYADKGLSTEAFKRDLEASGKNVKVKSLTPVMENGVALTKVVSTTDLGIDKVHYLLERNGTLIIFSVFINEQDNILPILQTLNVS